MSAGWEQVQEMAFTSWVNGVLENGGRGENERVKDICKDFDTGVQLIHFLEDLSGKVLKQRYDDPPKNRIQQISNVAIALNFLETLGTNGALSAMCAYFIYRACSQGSPATSSLLVPRILWIIRRSSFLDFWGLCI
eukprot:TRINITY_DN8362_c0_g1_i1.p1 TRINITY_DN8362_c0_g1~~TRINITY_DN8362_c0_g1_i1.p1  ORF type:complete len:148 (-),score=11.00 TRINITY_DN8362_c0_g1_i1:118-525(-)